MSEHYRGIRKKIKLKKQTRSAITRRDELNDGVCENILRLWTCKKE
jgi:hypothetical protein